MKIHFKQYIVFLILFFTISVFAQNNAVFNQRTSSFVDNKYKKDVEGKIYNLRGDFKLIGNTNLTFENYYNTASNSEPLKFVDVDNVSNTVNSSMAHLDIQQNECRKIVYAGLYWSGRAEPDNLQTDQRYIDDYKITSYGNSLSLNNISNGNNPNNINLNFNYGNYNNITYLQYILSLPSSNNQSNQIYLLVNNSSNNYNERVMLNLNGIYLPIGSLGTHSNTTTSSIDTYTVTFTEPYKFILGNYEYSLKSIVRRRSITQQNHITSGVNTINLERRLISKEPKVLDKRQVKIKNGTNDSYTTIEASESNINYPNSNVSGGIYVAYADITNLVKQKGGGDYYVADIATSQGIPDNLGNFGSWGMVVIYEDIELPWRDISVFDGYADIAATTTGSDTNRILNISGFNAAQDGLVNVTLGVMSGEGDVSIAGDYFQAKQRNTTNGWIDLLGNANPSGSIGGFFNSSVNYGNSVRNPNLQNNTGIDIKKFNLPNYIGTSTTARIIGNNDTSTSFRFGTTQDQYVIYSLVFAVDAYKPEAEGVSNVSSDLTAEQLQNLQPGQEVTFTLDIFNYGSEYIDNAMINLEIPSTMFLKSATMQINNNSGAHASPNFQTPKWKSPLLDPASNPGVVINGTLAPIEGGLIHWNLGTIPTQADPPFNQDPIPIATLTYTFKVTESCLVLRTGNDDCILKFDLDGAITGNGRNSNEPFVGNFITGYNNDCNNSPIYDPIKLEVTPSDSFFNNCSDVLIVDDSILLEYTCGSSSTIDYNGGTIEKNRILKTLNSDGSISQNNRYPIGTRFYSQIPGSNNYQQSEIFIEGWLPTWNVGETPVPNPNFQSSFPIQFTESVINGNIEERIGYIYLLFPNTKTTSCYYRIKVLYKTAKSPIFPDFSTPICLGVSSNFEEIFTNEMVFYSTNGVEMTRQSVLNSLNSSGTKSFYVSNRVILTENDFENEELIGVNLPLECLSEPVLVNITIESGPLLQSIESIEICRGRDYITQINTSQLSNIVWQYSLGNSWVTINNATGSVIPGVEVINGQLSINNASQVLNSEELKFRYIANVDNSLCASISNELTVFVKRCRIKTNPHNSNPMKRR